MKKVELFVLEKSIIVEGSCGTDLAGSLRGERKELCKDERIPKWGRLT